jgi:hypothetical protein
MFSKFKSNLFLRIIVFALIAYTVFAMNFTVSRLYYDTRLERGLRQLGIENTLLYVEPREVQIYESSIYDYCAERLDGIDGVQALVRNTLYGSDTTDIFHLITSSIYTSAVTMPMYKGRWFDSVETQDKVFPSVISYDLRTQYSVGDIFEFDEYQLRVVGIAQKGVYLPTNQNGGMMLNLNELLRNDKSFVIIQDENKEYSLDMCFSIVLEPHSNAADVAEKCRNALHNVANVFTYPELMARSEDYNGELIHMQGTVFIVMAMLSLIGAAACNLLLTLSDVRLFAIYYANGFSWESGLFLTVFQNMFFLLLPTILGLAVYYIQMIFMSSQNLTSSVWNWVISGVFVIVLLIITSILPVLTLRKNSPMNIIRKM